MKFVCTVCGYVHEGEAAPEKCPVCKVPASKFKVMKRMLLLLLSMSTASTLRPLRTTPISPRKTRSTSTISLWLTSWASALRLVCTSAWQESHTEKVIPRSVSTGKRQLSRKQSTQQSSQSFSVRTSSRT